MGGQISVNYTDIKPTKTIGCWRVHSAIRKTTSEKVSLWIIDSDLLSSNFPDKTARNDYLDRQIASVQTMRKVIHPHVLKILEIVDKKPDIGFASEPIENMEIIEPKSMHQLDTTYISYQIAETLSFINVEAHFLYLGLTPSNILVDNELNIHLMGFEYSTQLTGQTIVPSPQLLLPDPFADNTLRPPEFLSMKELSPSSDVFLFGLFLYNLFTGKKLYENAEPQQLMATIPSYIKSITGVPSEFVNVIKMCLKIDPVQRPAFSRVLEDPAFNSMQMKSLRYIDMILTKQPADKFKFYKGLSTKIDQFSPLILRTKILPRLLEECKNDVRFAPILLASIFQISQDYESNDFQDNVWKKISFLSGVSDPPEVPIALLRNMWLLLKKLDIRLHKDYVYPIFFNALQSPNPKVQAECLLKSTLIIDEMNENSIQASLIPRLIELISSSQNANVAASGMRCVSKCLSKVDNESFIIDFFSKIVVAWQKKQTEVIAQGMIEVMETLQASPDIMCIRVLPTASIIAGSHVCKNDLKNRFCDFVIKWTRQMRDQVEAPPKDIPTSASMESDPDNPFATPAPKANQTGDKAEDIFGTSSTTSSATSSVSKPSKPLGKAINIDVFGDSAFKSKPAMGSTGGMASLGGIGTSNRSTNPSPALDLGFGTQTSAKPQNTSFGLDFGAKPSNSSSFEDFTKPSTSAFRSQLSGSSSDVFRSNPSPGNTSVFKDDFGFGGSSVAPGNTSAFRSGFGGSTTPQNDSFGFGAQPTNAFGTQQQNSGMGFDFTAPTNTFGSNQNSTFGQNQTQTFSNFQQNRPNQNNNNNLFGF